MTTASEIEARFSLSNVVITCDDSGNVSVTADTPISDALHSEILASIAGPVTVITPRQLRLYLLSINRLAEVESILATLPGASGAAARIEWEFSLEVRRAHPLTTTLGQMLGLTSEELDSVFTAAAAL